jgi:hypothetical protein
MFIWIWTQKGSDKHDLTKLQPLQKPHVLQHYRYVIKIKRQVSEFNTLTTVCNGQANSIPSLCMVTLNLVRI